MTKYELTIYVSDEELYDKYSEAAKKQDENIKKDFYDSGFDMYVPETIISKPSQVVKVVSNVVCDMRRKGKPCGFYVYPRSSISKTPLRLANSVGIIDSGYRGSLIAKLNNTGYYKDGFKNKDFQTKDGDKYVQICMPDLSPFTITLVDNINDLGSTERGDGGFGSTNT